MYLCVLDVAFPEGDNGGLLGSGRWSSTHCSVCRGETVGTHTAEYTHCSTQPQVHTPFSTWPKVYTHPNRRPQVHTHCNTRPQVHTHCSSQPQVHTHTLQYKTTSTDDHRYTQAVIHNHTVNKEPCSTGFLISACVSQESVPWMVAPWGGVCLLLHWGSAGGRGQKSAGRGTSGISRQDDHERTWRCREEQELHQLWTAAGTGRHLTGGKVKQNVYLWYLLMFVCLLGSVVQFRQQCVSNHCHDTCHHPLHHHRVWTHRYV